MATQRHSPNTNNGTNIVGVHYKIGRKLGEGSFGIIYQGTQRSKLFFIMCVSLIFDNLVKRN